jgi:acyl carrier protein
VRQHIAEAVLMTKSVSFSDEDSLLERNVLDSLSVLELTEFLQAQFGIKIESEELLPENLETLNRIAAFVERKRS